MQYNGCMNEHVCFIYVLFDQDGKVNYVGRSINPPRRMNEHRRVLGTKPTFRIIDRTSDNCRNVERKWIEYFRTRGFILRNINYGQGPHFLSDAGKAKLSAAFKGRPNTWGDKISAAQKGIPKQWSEEGKARVQAGQFKKGERTWDKLSDEQKEKNRQSSRDLWKDPDRRARMVAGAKGKTLNDSRLKAFHKGRDKWLKKNREQVVKNAAAGAAALLAKDPENMSRRITKWWAEIKADPARYQEWLQRRATKIAQGKAK